MEPAITLLIQSIDGLRADVRAAAQDTRRLATAQVDLTRLLTEVFRDFKDELRDLRHARDRAERMEARLANLEVLAGGLSE